MHYHAEVLIDDEEINGADASDAIVAAVERILEPYGDGQLWDWYQIGGRWTGSKDGYDPFQDAANVMTCDLCAGTGFRRDDVGNAARLEAPTYTCNGCGAAHRDDATKVVTWTHGPHGPGRCVKWATEWRFHAGDIIPVAAVSDDLACHVLFREGDAVQSEYYDPLEPDIMQRFKPTTFGKLGGNVKRALAALSVTRGYLVTVDIHN